jgi:hypothetical protein
LPNGGQPGHQRAGYGKDGLSRLYFFPDIMHRVLKVRPLLAQLCAMHFGFQYQQLFSRLQRG